MIKVWQSYSCNNSSSYRLIARFADRAVAHDTGAELAEYFEAQERLGDHRWEAGALATLARTYGFDWTDSGAGYGGPSVTVEGDVLIVYHSYCLGLGPGVAAYLADRGGVPEPQSARMVQMSALFAAPLGVDPALDAELATLLAQPDASRQWAAPWSKGPTRGEGTGFRDAGTVGLYFPIVPPRIPDFKAWLAGHGIERVVLRIEDPTDRDLFAGLAAARCTACGGLLEYLDPRLHDIETPQLVCTPCGGLYDLKVFVP